MRFLVPSAEHLLDVQERLAAASLAERARQGPLSMAELFETALGQGFGGDPSSCGKPPR